MKKLVSLTAMALLLLSAVASMNATAVQGYQVRKIWSIPMVTNDVTLSKDGKYVAAVNNTGLYYFPMSSPTPNWWYLSNASASELFLSVAISANGEYVIVGNNSIAASLKTDSLYYFGNSTLRSGEQLSIMSSCYNWTSSHFSDSIGQSVERGTIDISDNGQYVVVGGSGEAVYYFANCTSKSGANQPWSWEVGVGNLVSSVDMSPDGNYIAVGGPGLRSSSDSGFVAFFVNATNVHNEEKWDVFFEYDDITEVEVSDDGYAVGTVSASGTETLFYWANATILSASPAANWTRQHGFSSVDVSSNGDQVVAGFEQLPISLHFWDNAKARNGTDETETWIELQNLHVRDVAISNDGSLIAATTYNQTSGKAELYFFASDDTFIASFALSHGDFMLSMSGDGQTVAVGGGADSLILYSFGSATGIPVGGFDTTPNYLAVLLALAGP